MYEELTTLFDEARLMLHRSVLAIERLHADNGVSVPMRAVLEFIRAHEAHTVSGIARARSVSRQHIQMIVNDLLDAGLVERTDNPNHLRAPLIGLTVEGVAVIDRLHSTERAAFEPTFAGAPGISAASLAGTSAVLRAIGLAVEQATALISHQEQQ